MPANRRSQRIEGAPDLGSSVRKIRALVAAVEEEFPGGTAEKNDPIGREEKVERGANEDAASTVNVEVLENEGTCEASIGSKERGGAS